MPMVKDYLYNKFKHGIEAGKLQYGVGQETPSAEVAEILATANTADTPSRRFLTLPALSPLTT